MASGLQAIAHSLQPSVLSTILCSTRQLNQDAPSARNRTKVGLAPLVEPAGIVIIQCRRSTGGAEPCRACSATRELPPPAARRCRLPPPPRPRPYHCRRPAPPAAGSSPLLGRQPQQQLAGLATVAALAEPPPRIHRQRQRRQQPAAPASLSTGGLSARGGRRHQLYRRPAGQAGASGGRGGGAFHGAEAVHPLPLLPRAPHRHAPRLPAGARQAAAPAPPVAGKQAPGGADVLVVGCRARRGLALPASSVLRAAASRSTSTPHRPVPPPPPCPLPVHRSSAPATPSCAACTARSPPSWRPSGGATWPAPSGPASSASTACSRRSPSRRAEPAQLPARLQAAPAEGVICS